MRRVLLAHSADVDGWRAAARRLIAEAVPPDGVEWSSDGQPGLFGEAADPTPASPVPPAGGFTVPRAFVELAGAALCHRDPERFALLYRVLWRLTRGEPHLLEVASDPDVHRAAAMAKAVGRDVHKMHAFVRFRERDDHYLAWFEPTHHIVERAAPFFAARFANMLWSILTPERSVHWDGERLRFAAGAERSAVPDEDALEAYWCAYYATIFNPARLKVAAMRAEMPKKYWRNLPEARLIPSLIDGAARRTAGMLAEGVSEAPARAERWARHLPPREERATELDACRRCDLWRDATQGVPGEGPETARLLFVGEQPGDLEDLAGKPFVGPAGKVLDRALADAGIPRGEAYVTNAVKHFKFVPRGKRRIHAKPDPGEIEACRGWLEREIGRIRPALIVALGATAGRAVLRRSVAVQRERGTLIGLADGTRVLVTVHPSFLLRLPDEAAARAEYDRFVADLQAAARVLAQDAGA